jgi:hypothetical protein
MQNKIKRKREKYSQRSDTRLDLDCLLPGKGARKKGLLTVYIRIKVQLDLQADKSPLVVKGPFFPRVVNPRYRICGTMCNASIQSSKVRKAIF